MTSKFSGKFNNKGFFKWYNTLKNVLIKNKIIHKDTSLILELIIYLHKKVF